VALIVLSVLIVLIGAAALARLWVMQQYYVGAQGSQLVIYQGVRGSVLGIPLQSRLEGSCPPRTAGCDQIRLSDLQEDARLQVRGGIQSTDGLTGARAIVQRLRATKLLPVCPTAPPAQGAPPANGQPGPNADPNADPGAGPLQSTPLEPGKTCRQES
jgi:hypothetical protein